LWIFKIVALNYRHCEVNVSHYKKKDNYLQLKFVDNSQNPLVIIIYLRIVYDHKPVDKFLVANLPIDFTYGSYLCIKLVDNYLLIKYVVILTKQNYK